MWNLKKCPRCNGDIFIDDDVVGVFEKCLQCGYEKELVRVKSQNRPAKKEKVGTA